MIMFTVRCDLIDTHWHLVCFTWRLLNSNSFAGTATSALHRVSV